MWAGVQSLCWMRTEAHVVAGAMSPAPSRLAPLPSPTGLSPRPRPKSLFVRLNSFRKASLLSLSSTASSPQCEAPAFTFDELLRLHKRKAVHPPPLDTHTSSLNPLHTDTTSLCPTLLFCINFCLCDRNLDSHLFPTYELRQFLHFHPPRGSFSVLSKESNEKIDFLSFKSCMI